LQLGSGMSTATSRGFEADDDRPTRRIVRSHDASRVLPLAGRILFALIFVMSTPNHFSASGVGYAASNGVPMPNVLVPLAGILALCGGLSIMLGYRAKIGAWMLVAFLIPVTLWMHRFWDVADAQMAQAQMINFTKNVALTGAALYMAWFGAGPLSLDARIARSEAREITRRTAR
jgi:putative oxidoreductase